MNEDKGYFRKETDRAGTTWYYDEHGNLHRIGGPAGETEDGQKVYYTYGKLHNLEGPARIRLDGTKEYFIEGIKFSSKEEWENTVAEIKKKT